MVDAAIKDIFDKLERDQSEAIKEQSDAVGYQGSHKKIAAVAAFGRGGRHLGDQLRKPDVTSVVVSKPTGQQVIGGEVEQHAL